MSDISIINPATDKPFASSYGGEDRFTPSLSRWAPMLTAPDDEVLEDWELNAGRMRELIEQNGLTSGAVQTHLDQIIGPKLRLVAKPDWKALGLTREWAAEWQQQVEAAWRTFSEDPDYRAHAARTMDVTQLLTQGQRSFMMTGEIFASAEWIERSMWPFRTAIQPIDPERISSPDGTIDGPRLRAGVEKDALGAPVAYWVREAHPYDSFNLEAQHRWKRVPREMPFGRAVMIHIFDQRRPGQTRGTTGMLSGIRQVKMLERWQQTSLQAAIINAMYAAVIESSVEHQAVVDALTMGGENPLQKYLTDALEFHKGTGKIRWDGSKIAHLFPGEKIEMVSAKHPVAAFEQFESAALRNLAASWNMSYEQLSRDYSKTNFSSARASMLEAWKFIISQRHKVAGRYAKSIYTLFLEDAIDAGVIELPTGAPAWGDPGAKRAYSQCTWIGPGRDHIDPKKGSEATEIDMRLGLTTLEEECALRGKDWREIVEQREIEAQELRRRGLRIQFNGQPADAEPDESEEEESDG